MAEKKMDVWELWYPKAAAAGLYFARSKVDPQEVVLVHSLPDYVTVIVRDENGNVKAQAQDLESTADSPMARLICRYGRITREDVWPGPEDVGRVVILPGGEAGVLQEWWNADDHSEWRWKVEFYNKR